MREICFQLPAYLRRNKQYNCGIAALNTIARHYGVSIRYQDIGDLVGINGRVTNLLALQNAAESTGFSAKGMKGSYDALCNIPLPAIAHVTTEDNIVILSFSIDGVPKLL